MTEIITIILPLILVALLGLICAKSQWLSRQQIEALSKFTFFVTIPAFLFYQMSHADFNQPINLGLFAAFYLPVLICYGLAWFVNNSITFERSKLIASKRAKNELGANKLENTSTVSSNILAKKRHSASALFALGASYSNTVIIGLPVLLLVIGEQVITTVFLIVTFHSALLFLLTSVITARSSNDLFRWQSFVINNVKNPLILSITLGALVNVLAIELPPSINDTLHLLGKPAITLALFVLGASLSFYTISGKLKLLYLATLTKLVLLPSLVWFFASIVFNLSEFTTTVLVILSASPTGVNAYLVAKNEKQQQAVVAGTVVMSTIFSIITLPLWLSLLLNV
ncbi:AEC family transporter [Colwellia asteriadis]|uniref:AEC family transporter n=1 Tax=Colwellia asteriadis TaxID=517723 RepID=A0ABN1LBD4_9GAMM